MQSERYIPVPPIFSCSDENLFDISDFSLISDYLEPCHMDPINTHSSAKFSSVYQKGLQFDNDTYYQDANAKKLKIDRNIHNPEADAKKEKNILLARKTRLRKKLYFEALQRQMAQLAKEREYLRDVIKSKVPSELREKIMEKLPAEPPMLVTSYPASATALLGRSDFHLITSIQTARRSFCITNPALPDNPIVFASDGFLELTGYTREQVLGKNCRFLAGPETDPKKVAELGQGIAAGLDTSVCLVNYRADGSTFINQLFVAALRNKDNVIVNYVGVQVEVADVDVEAIAHRPMDTAS